MAILKDKFYGLAIGCAIGDCMGFVADLSNQEGSEETVLSPTESDGYWNEPTSLMLYQSHALINHKPLKEYLVKSIETGWGTCTGEITNLDLSTVIYAQPERGVKRLCEHSTDCLTLMGAMAMHYYKDFSSGHLSAFTNDLASGCRVCMDASKFLYSLLDLALHGGTKKQILNPGSYANLVLCPEVKEILDFSSEDLEIYSFDGSNNVISCLRMVLFVFKVTNNFQEGVTLIVNNSQCPVRTGALLGSLCGAYYGLTDIKEDWIDLIQEKKQLTDIVKYMLPKIERIQNK
jgi:ADP-ribosylglycohydrolase